MAAPDESLGNAEQIFLAAAQLIRSLADHVSPGPWLTSNGRTHWLADNVVFGQSTSMAARIAQVCNVEYGQNKKPDASWIALMHPGVGIALAAWLEKAAKRHNALVKAAHSVWPDDPEARGKHIVDETDQQALVLARAVLNPKDDNA